MYERIRIALCDDHTVVRSGLRRILTDEDDIEVVGEAGTVRDAIKLAGDTHPDVFVMDLGLPDGSGIDAIAEVRDVSPRTRVLVLTVHDDAAYVRHAFEAGAAGYLVKEAADVELVQAVRQVAAGEDYIAPTMGASLLEPELPRLAGPGGELSEREVQVLRLVAFGLTTAEIAQSLSVSVRTIESHRSHIHDKLGARSRADLVRLARRAGLLDEPGEGP